MLQVRNLSCIGLQPLSFVLPDGACLAVQGVSGAGKTLLLRAIADLDPHDGSVVLNGKSRAQISGPAWRRQVVYVPAESGWWADTVGEHFKDLARAAPLLKTLHLTDEVAGWPVKRCSTGERARLALVRALVIDPAVLLLDEPTSALDEATTLAAEELVGSRIRQGMSVMWVTHDAAQARRVASRGLKILEGQVEEIALI